MEGSALNKRKFWIFDLDGTLTIAAHDFDAIRRTLGLSLGMPILEQLARLPVADAAPKRRKLQEIELEIARGARPQDGARELLTELVGRGSRLGVLTRNSHENALMTLEICRLDGFFRPDDIVGRESCEPKPSPDGVHRLLSRWRAQPVDAVVVGDYLFDLEAGRGAGTATVYLDVGGRGEWSAHADSTVGSLVSLLTFLIP